MRVFREKVETRRKELNWTRGQALEAINRLLPVEECLSESQYVNLEASRRSAPPDKWLIAISRALRLDLNDLRMAALGVDG